jgi:hypothetical protein
VVGRIGLKVGEFGNGERGGGEDVRLGDGRGRCGG